MGFLALLGGVIGSLHGLVRDRDERNRVQAARQDARMAEQQAQRLRARSSYDAARLAMQRGAWRAALTNLDRALAASPADSAAWRLERVRAWCAVHEVPRAVRELRNQARRNDLGDLKGRVLLWQADLALGQSDRPAQALKQVRLALRRGGLLPAKTAYARGLLAKTTPAAVRAFQEALDKDPWHQRANGMLGLLLILLGRRQEARSRITVAEGFFPDDPTFRLLHAALDALEGDMAAANASLDRTRAQLGSRQRAAARAVVDLLYQARHLKELLAGDPQASFAGVVLRLMPSFTRVLSTARDWRATEADAVLLLPVPPVLLQALHGLPGTLSLAGLGVNVDGALAQLARATEQHPDGLLYLARGLLLGGKDRWAEAEKAFAQASRAPSLIPVTQPALYGAASGAWVLSREGEPRLRPEMKQRAVRRMRRLLALGGISPE